MLSPLYVFQRSCKQTLTVTRTGTNFTSAHRTYTHTSPVGACPNYPPGQIIGASELVDTAITVPEGGSSMI